MPTVFEEKGYRFFFYSNEHLPVHIHVRHAGGEAIFEIENIVELRGSQKMKVKELAIALKLIEEHKKLILEKWNEHIS